MEFVSGRILIVLLFACLLLSILACDQPKPELEHLKQGDLYLEQGQKEQALAEYSKAVELDPDLAATHLSDLPQPYRSDLAQIYLKRALAALDKGETGTARRALTTAIKFAPNLAEAYCYRAIAAFEGGAPYTGGTTWDAVLADCNKAIELKPDYAKAYDARGFANYKRGRADQAISDFSKSIELDPNNANPYYHRGMVYYEAKLWDLALPDFSKSIELHPDGVGAYYYRGNIYSTKGQWDQAIADLSNVAAKASIAWPEPRRELAKAYYQRGMEYANKAERDRAIADLKKVIQLSDNDELKANAGHKLEELDPASFKPPPSGVVPEKEVLIFDCGKPIKGKRQAIALVTERLEEISAVDLVRLPGDINQQTLLNISAEEGYYYGEPAFWVHIDYRHEYGSEDDVGKLTVAVTKDGKIYGAVRGD